jgi:cephalosporin hydroxylase
MVEIFNQISSIDIKNITSDELERLLPEFGMNGESKEQLPKELEEHFNKGIRFWQYPNQFAVYLKHLSQYEINSYMEIGCRWGGTFIITNEILRKGNKGFKSLACDLINISDILSEYKKYNDFYYFKGDSAWLSRLNTEDTYDLILIDGDHSYEGVKKDFETTKRFKPKYVTFHDITNECCEGVVKFWNEIKNDYKHFEFTKQYDSVIGEFLGIGLIEI